MKLDKHQCALLNVLPGASGVIVFDERRLRPAGTGRRQRGEYQYSTGSGPEKAESFFKFNSFLLHSI
jgi:hypothetical protein